MLRSILSKVLVLCVYGAIIAGSFCFGKYILGERVLKEHSVVRKDAGKRGTAAPKRKDFGAFSPSDLGALPNSPKVEIKVKSTGEEKRPEAPEEKQAPETSRKEPSAGAQVTPAKLSGRSEAAATKPKIAAKAARREGEAKREEQPTEQRESVTTGKLKAEITAPTQRPTTPAKAPKAKAAAPQTQGTETPSAAKAKSARTKSPQPKPEPSAGTEKAQPPVTRRPPGPAPAAEPPAESSHPKLPPPAVGSPEERTVQPRTYRVQVGSFDSKERADMLSRQLNQRGYYTFTRTEQKGGKTLYRVQVGAYKDRQRAEDVSKELQNDGFAAHVGSE